MQQLRTSSQSRIVRSTKRSVTEPSSPTKWGCLFAGQLPLKILVTNVPFMRATQKLGRSLQFQNLNELNVLGMADMIKSDEKMHTHPPCADMNLPSFEHKDVPITGCHPVTNSFLTPVTYCVLSCLSSSSCTAIAVFLCSLTQQLNL